MHDRYLSQEPERLVSEAIRAGAYESPADVLTRALEVLRAEDLWLQDARPLVEEKIERAFAQFERGEFFSPEEAKAEMQRRKAEWLWARA